MCAVAAAAMGYKDLYLTGIDFYQEKRSLRISSPKKILSVPYFSKNKSQAISILWNMI